MEHTNNRPGFTLVEIMIVVAVIGLLAGLAISSFTQARRRTLAETCRNNLRLMEAAKQMAAMENAWDSSDGPGTLGNPYFRNACSIYMKSGTRPICPSGAACFYNALNEAATCESGIPSHVLHQ